MLECGTGTSLAEEQENGEKKRVEKVEKVACTRRVGVRTFKAVVNAAKMAANENGDIV
jgi:hypothetical protein